MHADLVRNESKGGSLGFIGQSTVMQDIMNRLPAVARARRTTLICGPTGTGKEMIARALHDQSPQDGPYVPVHCGALPEPLLEAELFGHTRGAFTGATQARPGLVRTAAGGTLFLDEIDCLSANAQAKLLRFLESGEFRSVGSDKTNHADTWVIAATNRDLSDGVRSHEFRADLMYRLDVMRLDLPPLSLRGSDIELLAQHFLTSVRDDEACTFSGDALAALRGYGWPGNVRELKHRVERAAIATEATTITAAMLALPGPQTRAAEASLETSDAPLPEQLWRLIDQEGLTLGEAVELCERLLIQKALHAEAENRTRAAQRLGIHTRTIFKKLRHA